MIKGIWNFGIRVKATQKPTPAAIRAENSSQQCEMQPLIFSSFFHATIRLHHQLPCWSYGNFPSPKSTYKIQINCGVCNR